MPGLLLFRRDAPLFFAHADHFLRSVLQAIAGEPGPVKRVVVAEPVTRIDLIEPLGAGNFHPTVGAAVDAHPADHGVDWTP